MVESFDAMWEMNKSHRGALLEAAKTQRLLTQSQTKTVQRRGRVIVAIGDFLITFGVRLKARYEPVA
jgi:hypothetical protein